MTTRTVQSRLLLRPSAAVRDVVLGVLGRAQARYHLRIHNFTFASNHYHLLCSPDDPQQLADFMCFVNGNIAREVGRLHDWRQKFWGDHYRAIEVSDEPEAQIQRLRYLLSHGCKEGLVTHPRDWPGAHCVEALLDSAPLCGHWFDRTRESAARRRGLELSSDAFSTLETVTLSPLPCWDHLDEPSYRERVADLVADIEREQRVERASVGRSPRGIEYVQRVNPHAKPLKTKRSPAPLVHAASRAVRRALLEARRLFVAAYRAAAQRLRDGCRDVQFPPHCFPPRLPYVRELALT